MKLKRTTVQCPTCGGAGRCDIPDHLAMTLGKIRMSRKPLTTDSLQEDGISNEAICNRLVELEKHGLIERAGKVGKRFLWKATPTAK